MSTTNLQRVFGIQVVTSVLQYKPHIVKTMWLDADLSNNRLQALKSLSDQAGIRAQPAQLATLKKLASDGFHQGVVADIMLDNMSVQQSLEQTLQTMADDATLLLLDGVQDPHNLGACLRSAEAAGVSMVLIPKDRAADITAVARRAACGAAELVPICRITNVARAIRSCQKQGFWAVGTSDSAPNSFYKAGFKGKVLLVMGSEGEGMRRLTIDSCDELLSLPMSGTVASLNVSVATGVCLFEIQRQRLT